MPFTITIESGFNLKDLQGFVQKEFKGRLNLELIEALRKVGREMRNDLQKTTSTWENHRVKFAISSSSVSGYVGRGSSIRGGVLTTYIYGSGDVDLWNSIDVGMDVWGRGSRDYSPKTSVRVFQSGPGSGSWNPFVNQLNVVEPRDWTGRLMEEYDERSYKYFADAIDKFISNTS